MRKKISSKFSTQGRGLSKYRDDSNKIPHTGNPAVYLLPHKWNKVINGINFVSINSPPRRRLQDTKIILIVGKTGAGKSTLINAITNYYMGVELKDDFRFKLIVEKQSTQAVTQKVTVYTIYPEESGRMPYAIKVIDTPGFSDTRGVEKDEYITSSIRDLFAIEGNEGITHIDCIGFVINVHENRLTPELKHAFQCVLCLFGNDIRDNIVLMLTHYDQSSELPGLKSADAAGIPYSQYFLFNASALYTLYNKTASPTVKEFWKLGERNFANFFQNLNKLEPKSLDLSIEVLDERKKLALLVDGILHDIRTGLDKSQLLRQQQNALSQNLTNSENMQFEFDIDVERCEKVVLPRGCHITNCLICSVTCHENCMIAEDGYKYNCVAMDDTRKNCKICPSKCVWIVHRNNGFKWSYRTEKVSMSLQEIQQRSGATGPVSVNQILATLQDQYNKNQRSVLKKTEEARNHINRLKEIALKPDPLSTTDYIELLILNEERNQESGWERRVEHLDFIKRRMQFLKDL